MHGSSCSIFQDLALQSCSRISVHEPLELLPTKDLKPFSRDHTVFSWRAYERRLGRTAWPHTSTIDDCFAIFRGAEAWCFEAEHNGLPWMVIWRETVEVRLDEKHRSVFHVRMPIRRESCFTNGGQQLFWSDVIGP